ncbi:ABC transporter substrate-binding protein [Marinobacterium sp. AK62]|uniref:ABC transporter substrate-binding protein n=1 Tax=Marinobacterium alkalitolerans TaxID=1542925 RepID=A0ABS3Z8F3_9GAMM|nr:ABC transporter substrate-binding protein [Marinobacterium alkalitolerans]MBP0047992.1 ABC transporter substrate-binding protein [Marinobacterium alkalitolerans]
MLLLALCVPFSAQASEHIRLGIQLEPPSLDPTRTAAVSASEITWCNLFEGLTFVNGEGQLRPRLAKSWTLSDDQLQYRFELRHDIRFHDGRTFNAEVAEFALQRLLDPGNANPQLEWYKQITGVKATDEYSLEITLKRPDAMLPFALSLPAAVMVHPDSAANNGEHPVGTGPYRFAGWEKGHSVTLLRNDDYWGKRPALHEARFLFMRTSVGTENMLAEGLVDGLLSVTRVGNRFLLRPDYRMSPRQLQSKMILAINNGRPPFDNLQVRRALSHAIDRQNLSQLYGPQFKPQLIGSHFPPSHPAYVDLVDRYPYDPERAKTLLREAGVEPGTRIALTIPPTDYGRYGGLMVAEDLERIGFRVELEQLDWSRWLSQVFKQKDYALTLIMHVEPMDLNIYARDNYYFNYDNTRFKAIWEQVLNAASETELHRLLGEAQRQLAEDAVNVFLFMRPEQNLMHRQLRGMWEKSPIPSFVLEDVYWAP